MASIGGLYARLQEMQVFRRLGFVLSLAVIAAAFYVLYGMLKKESPEKIFNAMLKIEERDILLAALFVACGYFTLTFYDLFALRAIGRSDVPYRIAALAGFTSYSIGHNAGASALTGGAVRYRV